MHFFASQTFSSTQPCYRWHTVTQIEFPHLHKIVFNERKCAAVLYCLSLSGGRKSRLLVTLDSIICFVTFNCLELKLRHNPASFLQEPNTDVSMASPALESWMKCTSTSTQFTQTTAHISALEQLLYLQPFLQTCFYFLLVRTWFNPDRDAKRNVGN